MRVVAVEVIVKLYTGPLSLFSAKVRIALAEKGLAFEHVSVGWSPEQRYEPLGDGRYRDVLLGRQVELAAEGSAIDPARILSTTEREGVRWLVLRVSGGQ